jgi:hypothetical protein
VKQRTQFNKIFLFVAIVVVVAAAIGVISFVRGIQKYNLQFPVHVAEASMEALAKHASLHSVEPPSSMDQIKTDPSWKLDPWRTPYRYRMVPGGFVITSAGPDKTFNTADDIVKTFNWDKLKNLDQSTNAAGPSPVAAP